MKVFKEEYYRSKPLVNMDNDMVRITINIPKLQWHLIRQRFMSLLAKSTERR